MPDGCSTLLSHGCRAAAADIRSKSNRPYHRVSNGPILPATQLQPTSTVSANFTAGGDDLSEQSQAKTHARGCGVEGVGNRPEEIRESRAYLGDLRLKVTRDPAADTLIPALQMRNLAGAVLRLGPTAGTTRHAMPRQGRRG